MLWHDCMTRNSLCKFFQTFVLIFLFAINLQAESLESEIGYQGDAVHVEFSGAKIWNYSINKSGSRSTGKVEILIDALSKSSIENLKKFKSEIVKEIIVDPKYIDSKTKIEFKLASDYVEYFDYQTDSPSRLIIDFYISEKNIARYKDEQKKRLLKNVNTNTKDQTVQKSEKSGSRSPATADYLSISPQGLGLDSDTKSNLNFSEIKLPQIGVYDGSDNQYNRFSIKPYEIKEAALIRSKENYYINFPMLQLANLRWEKVKSASPVYQIIPKNTDENKMARLLLTLFEKKRHHVFLKSLNWFREKYPNSEYNEIIDFMTGDLYLASWKEKNSTEDFDLALETYKKAIQKHPNSPLVERLSLLLGYLQLERGDNLAAIRSLNEHIDNKALPSSLEYSRDLARLGIAQAYMNINKFDEARQIYSEIESKSKDINYKSEAAYRKGDCYFRQRNYLEAILDYKQARKSYPDTKSEFPNSLFNQAESLFQTEQYLESLNTHREFIEQFPNHPYVALSMTRIGENFEILGADQARSMATYLETYFRFGESPYAIVARLRLLSNRMKGMKLKEVETTVNEIMELAKKSEIQDIEQFSTVMVADGFTRRKEYQRSLDLLISYFQKNPNQVNEKKFRQRIVSNINSKIRFEVDSKEFIKALKSHEMYVDNWLKGANRLDTSYFVGRAFELGGAQKEAEKYYREVLNKVYSFKSSASEKELLKYDGLPSEQSLNLRIAASQFSQGKWNNSYQSLINISNPETLSETEQIERVSLSVDLLEKKGDLSAAIRYLTDLIRNWKGRSDLLAAPYLKLAQLEDDQGNLAEALKSLEKIDNMKTDVGELNSEIHFRTLQRMAKIQETLKQTENATNSYKKMLSLYEEKFPMSSIRYHLGEIYFNQGEIQKAGEVWQDFKGNKSEFWKKMAQERLANAQWSDNYKKYIKRIPAMEGAQ